MIHQQNEYRTSTATRRRRRRFVGLSRSLLALTQAVESVRSFSIFDTDINGHTEEKLL
jgi:hypothetical protein